MAAGLRVTVTMSIDLGVGTAAALQLGAALGGETAHGLATLHLLESCLTRPPLTIEHGRMAVPDSAGLGVDLDDDAVLRYTLREWRFGAW
jgi:L-alanine-DL-glutamate epimerase-like enolase superfamily enzyme